MKIVQINATCGSGSTGKICLSLSRVLSENNIENYILYSNGFSDYPLGIRYMSDIETRIGALESRVFGNYGFNSTQATKRMIQKLNELNPDIVHLHNIHSHNCNLEILFNNLRRKDKKVVWTFHDCWAFTGSCTYFSYMGCEKWMTLCEKCPKAHEFSWFFDTSTKLFNRKKTLLKDLNLYIVTPSKWLAGLVKESFLKDYPVKVIHNGIDTLIFKPSKSCFRENYGITDAEKMILGVGFEWGSRKGLDVFIDLSQKMPSNYKIVLVGTNDIIDRKLPNNIISIHRTQNQLELAEIYTAADVFVNPTREDNYPTVNMEALACGTPVVTFKTGGSFEMLDESCGMAVEQEDISGLIKTIKRVAEDQLFSSSACLKKAKEFNQCNCFKGYLDLYRGI